MTIPEYIECNSVLTKFEGYTITTRGVCERGEIHISELFPEGFHSITIDRVEKAAKKLIKPGFDVNIAVSIPLIVFNKDQTNFRDIQRMYCDALTCKVCEVIQNNFDVSENFILSKTGEHIKLKLRSIEVG